MRTIRIKLYKFNELSEDAKQKALEACAYYNVDTDWYQYTYEDAESIGLKITGFDIDRKHITGERVDSFSEIAELIIKNHGKDCGTYKLADEFLNEWTKLVANHSDGISINKVAEDKEAEFDELADDLEKYYTNSLLEEYLIILSHEYEHLTSKEAIIETIEANEYEFTQDGKPY